MHDCLWMLWKPWICAWHHPLFMLQQPTLVHWGLYSEGESTYIPLVVKQLIDVDWPNDLIEGLMLEIKSLLPVQLLVDICKKHIELRLLMSTMFDMWFVGCYPSWWLGRSQHSLKMRANLMTSLCSWKSGLGLECIQTSLLTKMGTFYTKSHPLEFGGLPQCFHHRHQCSKAYMCL
jgi:hypothetical protein